MRLVDFGGLWGGIGNRTNLPFEKCWMNFSLLCFHQLLIFLHRISHMQFHGCVKCSFRDFWAPSCSHFYKYFVLFLTASIQTTKSAEYLKIICIQNVPSILALFFLSFYFAHHTNSLHFQTLQFFHHRPRFSSFFLVRNARVKRNSIASSLHRLHNNNKTEKNTEQLLVSICCRVFSVVLF